MEQHTISNHQIASFAGKLQEDERSPATIENYLRHIRAFAAWAGEQAVTKELVASWKEHLTGKDYRPGTVNTMLVSLNRFLGFLGWHDCVVKTLRIQRRLFREDSKELTREEYERLVSTAQASGRERLVLHHLLHRHPRLRGQVYHRRGPPSWESGNLPEGQDTHHPAAQQAVQEAAEVCQKTKDRLRRGVPHPKRHRAFQKTNLGGDEVPLRKGKGGGQ